MAGLLPEPDINYGVKFFWFPGEPDFINKKNTRAMPLTVHFLNFWAAAAMSDNYFPPKITTTDSLLKTGGKKEVILFTVL
jgi:hypothetical protein